uniref:Uncharacterized protein n=1 Tax=Oryza rufipogon TaxID=4529 RepID=A0A0E0RGY5_ORYRU
MMDGPAHRQGSASLDRFQKNMEKKEKRPMGIFEAYAEARKSGKDGEDYCTDRVKDKLALQSAMKLNVLPPRPAAPTCPTVYLGEQSYTNINDLFTG